MKASFYVESIALDNKVVFNCDPEDRETVEALLPRIDPGSLVDGQHYQAEETSDGKVIVLRKA